MISLGLTGGIGMGKSAAADLLAGRGIPVVDTDRLARELVAPGQPALEDIRRAFGPDVLDPDGTLRRGALARRVFADAEARRQLEAILHPRIRALWHGWLKERHEAGAALAVVVIPLLFEVGAERELDATLCVACSAATQTRRLRERGWSEDQIVARNAAQWPAARKLALARFGIWNEAGLDVLGAQLDRVVASLLPAR